MPQDSKGNYSMNPQIARMKDSASAAPAVGDSAAAPVAAPVVTITQSPDGGFEFTGPDGQPQQLASLDDVTASLGMVFGGDSMAAPADEATEVAPGQVQQ